jgi:hypothetical protein
MTITAQEKGKGRLLPSDPVERRDTSPSPSASSSSSSGPSSSLHSSSDSESDGEDSSEEESEDEISQECLDSLLEKARKSIAAKAVKNTVASKGRALEDDMIALDNPESEIKHAFFKSSIFYALTSPKEATTTGSRRSTASVHHVWENAK